MIKAGLCRGCVEAGLTTRIYGNIEISLIMFKSYLRTFVVTKMQVCPYLDN